MEEKNNQNKNKGKEKCPLCKVSEETIKRLKERPAKGSKTAPPKKSSRKFKIWLLIFVFAAGGFVLYQLIGGENLTREQSGGEEMSILDKLLPQSLEVGDLAPDFVSEDVYGNKISLSDFQPVLLVFWATWCGYCAKELPDLKNFTRDYQDKIQIIAVSSGESKETIKNYIKEKDVNFLMLLDENREVWNIYLVRGTPSHFLIDTGGKIVTLRPGLASREDLEIMTSMLTELW